MKRRIWIGPLALLFALGVRFMALPTDKPEAEIGRVIESLRRGLSDLSASDEQNLLQLNQWVEPSAHVEVADFPLSSRGAKAMLEAALRLGARRPTFEIKSQQIALSPDAQVARVLLEVNGSSQRGGATRLDSRRVTLRLRSRGRNWKIEDLTVLAPLRDYPEARP